MNLLNNVETALLKKAGLTNKEIIKIANSIEAFKEHKRILGQIPKDTAPNLEDLYMLIGTTYFRENNIYDALDYYKKCGDICEKKLPKNDPDLASLYVRIGIVSYSLEEYVQALDYYKKSRIIFQQILPPNHIELANLYLNIGNVYSALEDYVRALNYYKKCKIIREKALSEDDSQLAIIYTYMGETGIDGTLVFKVLKGKI